jgi:uncharacterized metal-binding protein (TIGR02443 family)
MFGHYGDADITFKPLSRNRYLCNASMRLYGKRVVVKKARLRTHANSLYNELNPRTKLDPIASTKSESFSNGTLTISRMAVGASCPHCNTYHQLRWYEEDDLQFDCQSCGRSVRFRYG